MARWEHQNEGGYFFNRIQERKHIDIETKSEVNKTIGKLNYIPT